jgi:hypothetical protein
MISRIKLAAKTVASLDIEGMERKLQNLSKTIEMVEEKVNGSSNTFTK